MAHTYVWDSDQPAGNTKISLGDDKIRQNQKAAQERVELEHQAFSDTIHGGRHLANTARVGIGTFAARPVYSDAYGTGKMWVVYDPPSGTNHGAVYYCVAGATDTWIELLRFGGSVTLAGGLVLPSGQTIEVPPGEASITDGTTRLRLRLARLRRGH
jgi:hypothetical protein